MYKHKSKNYAVKLNSAMKNTDTDLQNSVQTCHSSCAVSSRRELAGHPQSEVKCLCINVPCKRISWILGQHHIKTVMITDVLPLTRKAEAGTSFRPQ